MPSDLAADTTVTRLAHAPGWYVADLPPDWNYFTPSGGVLMTVALRAMQLEAGPGMRPISANTLFMSPVPHGPLEVRVEVLRRGNVAVQMRAALSSTTLPGPGLEVSATFAKDREGPEFTDRLIPDEVVALDAAEPYFAPDKQLRGFFAQYDVRLALGHRWWQGRDWERSSARYARWWRYRVPQRLADGTLDPLALPPIADTMPAALLMKLGPQNPSLFMPSLDLTLHFLAETRAEWILGFATCRRTARGYATADIELWGADGALVAFGTQTMILRRAPGIAPE